MLRALQLSYAAVNATLIVTDMGLDFYSSTSSVMASRRARNDCNSVLVRGRFQVASSIERNASSKALSFFSSFVTVVVPYIFVFLSDVFILA